MKCYIVAVGEELGVFSYDYKYHVFITKRKAQSYFKKAVAEKLAESDYSEDELKEMLNNITDTEYFDIESRWVVCIAKGIVGK